MAILDIAGAIAGPVAGIAQNVFGIGEKRQDKRQISQQEKLNELNSKTQMEMWNKTGYGAQKNQMEEAGINPALMYGMGGGGGQSVGGGAAQAATGAANTQASTGMGMSIAQMGMMAAQKANIEADTKKKEVEANKLAGVDTEAVKTGTAKTAFDLEVNRLIGANAIAERYGWVSDKLATESQKTMAEWEAYKAAGFEGKPTDDPNSPVAKAMKAGFDKAVTDLENARTAGKTMEAEQAVKEFEAGLAKQGISPNSPWWVKIVGDLLEKVGLGVNPMKTAAKGVVDTLKR